MNKNNIWIGYGNDNVLYNQNSCKKYSELTKKNSLVKVIIILFKEIKKAKYYYYYSGKLILE